MVGKHNSSSEDIWLIHVPFVDVAYLENIFKKTPLRLDSAVFAFSKDNEGWFKKLEMKAKTSNLLHKIEDGASLEAGKNCNWEL